MVIEKLSAGIASLLSVLVLSLIAGCASDLGGGSYERSEARGVMSVRFGEVTTVRPVKLEGTESGVGTMSGAAVGGIAGSTVGGGRGSAIAAVIGAVAGGMAGAAIEDSTTRRAGVEVTVKLDSGQYIAVVQEDGGENFRLGERVRVLDGRGTTRVSR
ncbi:MAG: glycine zipper 2TM domain-containing protein [Rhodocyclaceae bacterium]|nr:glycine zipper 2TM domain-containing protein [Rhodocyclaceae bacterium]